MQYTLCIICTYTLEVNIYFCNHVLSFDIVIDRQQNLELDIPNREQLEMFRFYAVIAILDTLLLMASFAIQCDMNLPDVMKDKSNPIGRYLIEVSGHPRSYTPNQKYTVTLRATNDADENKFVNFVLLVENTDQRYGDRSFGSINLMLGDALTKYKCSNAVMETNSISKSEIQVLWVAPPSDNGCVVFKATVFVTREIWYSEDGPLTLTLCENPEDNDHLEPPILPTCCACHEAKYEVTFESLWSRNTHPKDFPPNNFVTKFSDIIGATHSVDYKFWSYNEYASEGLKKLAQEGDTKQLETELKDKSNYIRTIIKARGISYPNITGKTFAVFRVDDRHHLVSLVSMIYPSPDWIVGVSGLELCQSNCSWVESMTFNLYPLDAGTDNGTTYLSEDSPTIPAAPITRITPKSSEESPFYDENSNEMKPLARLILSRQRLYEKHNCEGPDSKELPDLEEYCAVTEWPDWSPCNVDCGRGTRHRQRTYKLKVVDQHKQRETCKKTLTQRSSCYGVKPECPVDGGPPAEECELTPWGKWSECSVTCGNGTKTRSRRYRSRAAAKYCQQITNSPTKLEQNFPCSLPPCDWTEPIPPECAHRAWSEWSICSVTCGKGTKMRRKLSINIQDLNRHNRISRSSSFDEESEEDFFGETTGDECENVIERVECYNDEAPSCDESTTIPALACSLAVDVGLCRSNVDRWHFNSIKGKCELFSYSGCEGNKNNFRTLEMCERVCNNYQKDAAVNRTLLKLRNSGVTASESQYQLQNDEAKQPYRTDTFIGETNDCVVSKWSRWSACSATCGRGFKTKTRRILQPAGEGGKPCPEKLKKKKKCKLTSCSEEGDQDCIMSKWSSWSPCTFTCGPNAERQRTRNILQQPTGNGQRCESRVDIIKCDLTVCPDF